MKLTIKQIRQIIVEEMESFGKMHPRIRKKRKREAVMAILFLESFIDAFLERLIRIIEDSNFEYSAYDTYIYDIIADGRWFLREIIKEYSHFVENNVVSVSQTNDMIAAGIEEDKYWISNKQLYGACLEMIKIVTKETPVLGPGPSIKEAYGILKINDSQLQWLVEDFPRHLKNTLEEKETQSLFDNYEVN